MARVLVRLKLALLASSLRRGWQQAVGLAGAVVAVPPLAFLAAAGMVWLGGQPAGDVALAFALTAVAVAWTIGPPLTFGLDETLDPAKLALLPLSGRRLAAGLLAASLVGVGPLATAILLVGVVVGFTPAVWALPLVALAAAGHLLLCVLLARVVTSLLSRWLRSRRGQDALVVAGALAAASLALFVQLPRVVAAAPLRPDALLARLEGLADALVVAPTGWSAAAITAVGDGEVLLAVAWLTALAGLLALLARVWVGSVQRSVVRPSAVRRRAADRALFAGPLRLLPRNRLGAATAKEVRYLAGQPQLRVQWLLVVLLAAGLASVAVLATDDPPELLVLAIAAVAVPQGMSMLNAFGADRGAVWTLLAVGGIGPADVAGKHLAAALLLLPLLGAVGALLAAASGGWSLLPLAAVLCVAVLGVTYGIGGVVSVLAPSPLREAPGSAWSGATGAGCATALSQAVAVALAGALLLPPAAAVVATWLLAPAWTPLAVAAVALYGLAVWGLGVAAAAALARRRGPELLAALEA